MLGRSRQAVTQDAATLAALDVPPSATAINVVGTLVGGGTVGATFTLNGGTAFQTFTFPAEWQNLVAVKFSGNNDGTSGANATGNALFAMDNIVFTPGAAFTCSYALAFGGRAFGPAGGGPVGLSVTATPGCPWNSSALPPWVHVDTSGGGNDNGIGNGIFAYFVDPNPGAARSATITVAGTTFTIEQAAASIPGLGLVGSMPHIAAQENWTTTFTLVNKSTTSSQARLTMFGDPSGGLTLPLSFPQSSGWSGPLLATLLDRTLAGNASLIINTAGPQTPPVRVGSAQLAAAGSVDGFAMFDTPAGGRISVLGIRTTPLGSSNTLTTIPPLASVGTNGGSIAHIATGNGWQTTFVLVNTGTSAAQAHLRFFADDGTPLSLPLGFPQSGSATTTVAATVDQALAAGATLIVQSAAPLSDPAPTMGSAQLTTDGHVGGFVIFRYNPNGQEAVVPMENRTASAYVLAFDNTNGTATSVAINTVSAQTVNIPVVVRDDTGTQIATDTLPLAGNGHLAFTLVTDKYPATANIRGTIEFGTPAGGVIGALGIRIPVAHTFTTLPPLAK